MESDRPTSAPESRFKASERRVVLDDMAVRMVVIDSTSTSAALEQMRTLMREYAALPHTVGRWHGAAEDIAALPAPFVAPTGLLLMAASEAEALACGALLALDREIMEIKRVYVRPEARGLGLGAHMTTSLLRHAKRLGASSVRLDTAPELHAARALYERLGFRPIDAYQRGMLPDTLYYERGLHDIDPQERDTS